jgi:hypothetical protein
MGSARIVNPTHLRAALLVVAFAYVLQPCHAANVQTRVAPDADFARYKTYQWLPPRVLTKTGVVEDDAAMNSAIKDAVNRQLVQRGLKEVPEGADLQISAGVLTASVPQLEAVWFAGPSDLTFATPIANMGRYNKEGTLIVNLIDTRTKKWAWIGVIKENVDNKPGSGQKKLPGAAAKLFKKFPVVK